MKQNSGFDALIEALKQSGINMDGKFDADTSYTEAQTPGSDTGGSHSGGSGGTKPPRPRVEIPFADKMANWVGARWLWLRL